VSFPKLDGHDQDLYDRGLLHVNDPRRAGAPTVPARRDPTAATRPVQWQTPGQPMVPEWDADTATRWAYYANVIAWRCIDLRARTVAALPFRAGTDMPDRPGEAAPHNPRSRLAQLLGPPPGGPAPKLTARRLWDWTMRQKLVTGRWGWEVETTGAGAGAGGQVAALWPLVSGSLRAIPTTSGTEWFGRFEYGPVTDSRTLPADRVIYGWHPMMSDFRQPESAFQAARLDLSIAVMGDRYSYAFLKNGAVPAYVVTTTEFPTESLREAFRSQWNAAYRGPDAAGSTHFHEVTEDGAGSVGDAIDIKTVALSQKDSQFVAQHQASLERVAIALGVPWSKLDASGRTFDNAAQEDRDFWTMTVLDDLRDLTDEINLQLAPRVGGEVGWFDTSGVEVLKTAPLFTATDAVAMVSTGIITRNEARVPFGLPPVDGGDVLDQPAVPAPMPPQLAAGSDLGRGGADAANNKSRTNDLTGSDRLDVPDPPAPETRALTVEEHEQRRAAVWRRHDSIVRGLEAGMERRMRRLFARQATATLSRLRGNRGRTAATRDPAAQVDPAAIFDAAFWRAEAADVSSDAFEAIFAAGGARVSDQFGLAFDLQAPYATQFIEARANQLAGAVTDTTYSQITAALAQGALEGDDIPALAARVQHVFDVASDARATTIARTETISAYNGSASAVAASYGQDVVGGQEWISTVDGRTRPEHAGADGQVVGIGQAFDVGGELLAYPGDPNGDAGNIVNCRCTVAFLTPDEMGERGVRPVGRRMSVDAGARVLELVARVRSSAA
jgi:HK97 family phage portal protein